MSSSAERLMQKFGLRLRADVAATCPPAAALLSALDAKPASAHRFGYGAATDFVQPGAESRLTASALADAMEERGHWLTGAMRFMLRRTSRSHTGTKFYFAAASSSWPNRSQALGVSRFALPRATWASVCHWLFAACGGDYEGSSLYGIRLGGKCSTCLLNAACAMAHALGHEMPPPFRALCKKGSTP